MEIVIENPTETTATTPSSLSPSAAAAAAAACNVATSPSLAMHPGPPPHHHHHHHPHHRYSGVYGPDGVVAGGGGGMLLPPASDYYARQQQQQQQRTTTHSHLPSSLSNDLDGAATASVRRVDRSGLLEIPEIDPARNRPRLLTGAENVASHMGTLSRRVDRSGLLEAVPEVPDQQGRKSPDPGTTRTCEEGVQSSEPAIGERQLTGAETSSSDTRHHHVGLLSPCAARSSIDCTGLPRGRSQGSLDEIEPRRSTPETRTIAGSPQDFHATSRRPSPTSPNPYYRFTGGSPANSLRTSPLVGACADVVESGACRARVQFCPSTKFVPIEPHASSGGSNVVVVGERQRLGTCLSSPPTLVSRSCSTDPSPNDDASIESAGSIVKEKKDCLGRSSPGPRTDNRRSPMMTLSMVPDVIEAHGSRVETQTTSTTTSNGEDTAPEGERAEAEGCEHSATVDGVEEARVTFKAPNKLLHNENVQTLRVIILSEQL